MLFLLNLFDACVAEWSKAVASGAILNWRRFESCLMHPPRAFCYLQVTKTKHYSASFCIDSLKVLLSLC